MVGSWSSRYVQMVVRPDRTWDCSVLYSNLPECVTSQGTNSLLMKYGGTTSGDLSMYSFVQDTTGGGYDHIVTSCTARYETSGASETIARTEDALALSDITERPSRRVFPSASPSAMPTGGPKSVATAIPCDTRSSG